MAGYEPAVGGSNPPGLTKEMRAELEGGAAGCRPEGCGFNSRRPRQVLQREGASGAGALCRGPLYGRVAERLKAPVSKTGSPSGT